MARPFSVDLTRVLNDIACHTGLPLGQRQLSSPADRCSLADKCEAQIVFLFYKDNKAFLDNFSGALASLDWNGLHKEEKLVQLLDELRKARSEFECRRGGSIRNSYLIPSASTSANSSANVSANTSFTTSSSSPPSANTSFSAVVSNSATIPPGCADANHLESSSPPLSDLPTIPPKVPEHHKIKNLPKKGLFIDSQNQSLLDGDWRDRYRSLISSSDISTRDSKQVQRGRSLFETCKAQNQDQLPSNEVLSGRLEFTTSKDNEDSCLFRTRIHDIRFDPESHRFSRAFGSNRFLTLKVPSLRKDLPDYCKDQEQNLASRFQEWLITPDKPFMGYLWTVFYFRPLKKKGKGLKHSIEHSYEVILFATKGHGLCEISIERLFKWFMSPNLNKDLSSCKAYARIELGLSKTRPTIVFNPSQICWRDDIMSNGEAEDSSFNDVDILWEDMDDSLGCVVMNDGCSLLSPKAAKDIWNVLQISGPTPSAFQARIGPWKGMWFVSDPSKAWQSDESSCIYVTKSQQKFMPYRNDSNSDGRNITENGSFIKADSSVSERQLPRVTFEVLEWSRKPTSSALCLEYMLILEDRGVSRAVLTDFIVNTLAFETTRLLNSIESPKILRKWIQDTFSYSEIEQEVRKSHWPDGMPTLRFQKANFLLESGFTVQSCDYLRDLIQSMASDHFNRLCTKFQIPIEKSTMVYGVADPTSELKPGEIHLCFSTSFVDDRTLEATNMLHDVEVLVSRHPACRPSDIQKVRAIFCPSLRNIMDVAVFSSRGCCPLASKLQGGDYDGDRFWICWDPVLVQPFRNAPVPRQVASPEILGIKTDQAKLGDHFQNGEGTVQFLKHNFARQFENNFLGICTLALEKLQYFQNTLTSSTINELADLHDYLVDSSKNGYSFSETAWKNLQHKHKHINWKGLHKPAYKKAADVGIKEASKGKKSENIMDYLMFDVAGVEIEKALQHLKSVLPQTDTQDGDLAEYYWSCMRSKDELVTDIVRDLEAQLQELVNKEWPKGGAYLNKTPKEVNDHYRAATRTCRRKFMALTASTLHQDVICGRSPPDIGLSNWDCLKASTLYAKYHRKQQFVFACAGYELGCIKAWKTLGTPRIIIEPIYENMKMGKLRETSREQSGLARVNEDELTEEESEGESYGGQDNEGYLSDDTERHLSQLLSSSSLDR